MVESSTRELACYRFADITVDTAQRLVLRGSEVVALPRLTYRMLLTLVEAAPRVLTYDDLVDAVWDGRAASPETVKQRVKLLRDALSDDATEPRYIGLSRGQGYHLVPEVTRVDRDAARPPGAFARARWLRPAIAALVLLAAAAGGLFEMLAPEAERRPAVAVLPFVNAYGDDESDAYVFESLSNAVIADLGRVAGLDVLSGTSSGQYAGREVALAEIAKRLDANFVVDGAVVRGGDRLVVSVQVVDAGSGENVWERSFDLRIEDLPGVQSAIVGGVAESAGLRPVPGTGAARKQTIDPESYEAYLRGMYALNQGTPEAIERGLGYLHEAVDENPGDAFAYAGLALGYATYGHGLEPRHDAWPRARAAALRALTLDPALAEAHAALADVKLYSEWDWSGAEASFKRANELNPSLAMNHYHYAWYLVLHRRFDEAIAEHERARELDPLNPLHTYWLGGLYLYQDFGRYREAIREVRTALELDPDNPTALLVLGLAQAAGGMHEQAIASTERGARISTAIRAPLGLVYHLAGREQAARAVLAELDAMPTTPWRAYWKAVLNARLGNLDAAFRWLAYEPHHAFVPWIRVDPWVRHLLEDDPRFAEFLARVGLEP